MGNTAETVSEIIRERKLDVRDFEKVSRIVQGICGINLHDGKRELVQARLSKRLRQLRMDSFSEYLRLVDEDTTGAELSLMVDLLTTNLTYFFRERSHLDFLSDNILPEISKRRGDKLRIWSAGCSSGEEPYSLAMVMREAIPDIDFMDARLLATDISSRMLKIATTGVYREERFKETPAELKKKYFTYQGESCGDKMYAASHELRRLVHFKKLNLMDSWPMKGQFDVVFCRNVMIYFDKPTQQALVNRFHSIIRPGGWFLTGHAESLAGISHGFNYVRPSIYKKA